MAGLWLGLVGLGIGLELVVVLTFSCRYFGFLEMKVL